MTICILLNDKLEARRILGESLRLVIRVDVGIVVFIGVSTLLIVNFKPSDSDFLIFLADGSWVLLGKFDSIVFLAA